MWYVSNPRSCEADPVLKWGVKQGKGGVSVTQSLPGILGRSGAAPHAVTDNSSRFVEHLVYLPWILTRRLSVTSRLCCSLMGDPFPLKGSSPARHAKTAE